MTTETYNGWTNRETWLVNLWLTNDEATYNDVREGLTELNGFEAQEWLEGYVDDMHDNVTGMIADLLNTALSRVNWPEIVISLKAE